MVDSTDKKGPIRISQRFRQWLDGVAAQEFARTGRRPSAPTILDRLLDTAKGRFVNSATPAANYPEADRDWHDLLQLILNDPAERSGIEHNLRWGANEVKGKRPLGRRRAAVDE